MPSCDRPRFTQEDDNMIIAMAGEFPAKVIATTIGRELAAVHSRACLLRRKGIQISLCLRGDKHHHAKYSNHDVFLMRELFKAGLTCGEIAKKFEMKTNSVSVIVRNRSRLSG